jgi:hypothetical protein
MWRGKPNHCFIVSVTTGDASELYLAIARDEADAEHVITRRYTAHPGENVKCEAQCTDEIVRKCKINLDQHGAFAVLDLVWIKTA